MVDQITKQQRNDCAALALTDWAGLTERILGVAPWDKQKEILDLLQENRRVAVRSCHGSGKSFIAASAVLCFLADCQARDMSGVVITTAPTFRQVEEVLWREIASHHSRAKKVIPLGGTLLKTRYEMDDSRRALGISTDNPDQFQGIRAERTFIVVDEAAGVTPDIYEAIEGILSGEHCKLLLIGNPTAPIGEFYNAFTRNRGLYKVVHINAFDTPNVKAGKVVVPGLVTADWVKERAQMWGEDSPMYQSRVLGDFPEIADDTVIPLHHVERAMRREGTPGPKIVALDVARFGTDYCCMATADGDIVHKLEMWGGKATDYSGGRLEAQYRAMRAEYVKQGIEDGPVKAVVDDTGLGAGVTDHVKIPVIRFIAAGRARADDTYKNVRAEAWFMLKKALAADELTLPDDAELAADLTAPKYKYTIGGQIQLEIKEDTKKRLGRSPDRADAVVMANYYRKGTGGIHLGSKRSKVAPKQDPSEKTRGVRRTHNIRARNHVW